MVPVLDGLSTAMKFVWTLASLLGPGECVALAMISVSWFAIDVRAGWWSGAVMAARSGAGTEPIGNGKEA